MTPKDRAGAAASLYSEDYLGDGGTVPPLEDIIEQAIIDAVDDATKPLRAEILRLRTALEEIERNASESWATTGNDNALKRIAERAKETLFPQDAY